MERLCWSRVLRTESKRHLSKDTSFCDWTWSARVLHTEAIYVAIDCLFKYVFVPMEVLISSFAKVVCYMYVPVTEKEINSVNRLLRLFVCFSSAPKYQMLFSFSAILLMSPIWCLRKQCSSIIPLPRGFGLESPDIEKPQNPSKTPELPKPSLKKEHAAICMQDSWLHFPGFCLNRTAVQWRSCCLFAFLCFGEWLSKSRFGMACTFLLLKPPRVIWCLDAILTVRKKHLLCFSVFLVCLALFLSCATCKSCLMQFGRNGSQFQTEIMAHFLSSSVCNHTWEN